MEEQGQLVFFRLDFRRAPLEDAWTELEASAAGGTIPCMRRQTPQYSSYLDSTHANNYQLIVFQLDDAHVQILLSRSAAATGV